MRLFLNGKDLGEHAEFHLLVAVDPAGETIPAASIIVGGGPLCVDAQQAHEPGLYIGALRLKGRTDSVATLTIRGGRSGAPPVEHVTLD